MLKAKSLKHQTIQKYQTIVGRGVLTPPPPTILWRSPPILPSPPLPLFKFCPTPPPSLSPPIPTPTALSVVLFLWQIGWSRHIWCAISLRAFHATRGQVYCVWHNVIFCYYSDLILHTPTHLILHTPTHTHAHKDTKTRNTLRGKKTDTHPFKYIHHLLCAHSNYLYYIEWSIHWYQNFTYHNVFSFQKLFTCTNHISVE